MALEAVDFPSDPYNYTGSLRKELTLLYGRAQYSRECLQAITNTLEFYYEKLQEVSGELEAYLAREAEKSVKADEANRAIESAPKPAEPEPKADGTFAGEMKRRVTPVNTNKK